MTNYFGVLVDIYSREKGICNLYFPQVFPSTVIVFTFNNSNMNWQYGVHIDSELSYYSVTSKPVVGNKRLCRYCMTQENVKQKNGKRKYQKMNE